eukprot:TRINITY_DN12961_c0_g1_i2.p1 TRINITY_DN12961_c0_g1~~TRINITY_DN12961_c0_g1_i2.p1  ORF type:complete len:174 (+),score=13.44 TRINITY_DN12961_c0_g1_i2:42-563(+)
MSEEELLKLAIERSLQESKTDSTSTRAQQKKRKSPERDVFSFDQANGSEEQDEELKKALALSLSESTAQAKKDVPPPVPPHHQQPPSYDIFSIVERPEAGMERTVLYELRCVVHHRGVIASSGHYFCDVAKKDSFQRFDDSMVTQISEKDVFHSEISQKQAYMFFYVMSEEPK